VRGALYGDATRKAVIKLPFYAFDKKSTASRTEGMPAGGCCQLLFIYSPASCAKGNLRAFERCFIQNLHRAGQLQRWRVNHPEIQREKHQQRYAVRAARMGSDLSSESSLVGLV